MLLTTARKCGSCYDQVRPKKMTIAPCKHQYCHRCLQKMVLMALEMWQAFPVRCCGQNIPMNQVLPALNNREKCLYTSRVAEEAVPPAQRWYCPHTNCRRWIDTRQLKPGSKNQKCPCCRTLICSQCRDLAHENRECVEDPGLPELLEVARRHHWQRCYNCHAMVGKTDGCQHIKCLCGADFW